MPTHISVGEGEHFLLIHSYNEFNKYLFRQPLVIECLLGARENTVHILPPPLIIKVEVIVRKDG